MNSEEALIQIEALEAALLEEQGDRELLEATIRDLETRNSEIEADIQAFKADIWSIDEVQQALEAVSRTGSEFVIQMDHRLRTTLIGMLGMVEQLMSCDLAENELDYVTGAKESGRDLMRMLNAIVDYCHMDAGYLGTSSESVSSADLLNAISDPVREAIESKGLEFSVSMADDVPESMEMDVKHVARATRHLLDNALRFTESGKISLSVDLLDAGAEERIGISITDTGQGIASEDLSRVREAFECVESAEGEGIGLGLSVVGRLAEMLDGSFELTSKVGEGTKGYLTIPTHPISDNATDDIEAASNRAPGLSKARVLVVEDNMVNQKVAKGFLQMLDCEVETADNGLIAIDMLASKNYDLIIMDCMMPELDGYGATKRIRGGAAGSARAKIPIIALTADDTNGNRRKCLRSGMDDYMNKPVRIDRLRDMLRIWLPAGVRPPAEN